MHSSWKTCFSLHSSLVTTSSLVNSTKQIEHSSSVSFWLIDRALYLTRPRLLNMSFDADLSFARCLRLIMHIYIIIPMITRSKSSLSIANIRNINMTNIKPPFSSLHPSDLEEKYSVKPQIYHEISEHSLIAEAVRKIIFFLPLFSSQYKLPFILSFISMHIVSTIRKKNCPASQTPSGIPQEGCSESRQMSTAPMWR